MKTLPLTIIASQVEIGKTYFITGISTIEYRTITNITRSKSGRYIFHTTLTTTRINGDLVMIQEGCSSTPVVGHKLVFDGIATSI